VDTADGWEFVSAPAGPGEPPRLPFAKQKKWMRRSTWKGRVRRVGDVKSTFEVIEEPFYPFSPNALPHHLLLP
jgi:hypothetical protein